MNDTKITLQELKRHYEKRFLTFDQFTELMEEYYKKDELLKESK
jgi:hypothetical protein